MINSLFDTTLTQAEIDQLVACLFDKDLPTPQPAPFSSENPPPVVRVSFFFRCSLSSLLNKPVLLVNLQGLYPDRHTDVEVSSGNDDVLKIDALDAELRAPASDEAEGEGICSAEPIALGPISSNTLAQANPSIANQVVSIAPSAGGQKRKCPLLIPKHKLTMSSADQVMTQIELPPYREPRCPLDLVTIEIIFGCLFETF
jgi:hypothetical protein